MSGMRRASDVDRADVSVPVCRHVFVLCALNMSSRALSMLRTPSDFLHLSDWRRLVRPAAHRTVTVTHRLVTGPQPGRSGPAADRPGRPRRAAASLRRRSGHARPAAKGAAKVACGSGYVWAWADLACCVIRQEARV